MSLSEFLERNPKRHLVFDLDGTIVKLHIDWSTFRRQLWDTVATFDEGLTREVPFEKWRGIELVNKSIAKHGERAKRIIFPFNAAYELAHLNGYTVNTNIARFIQDHRTDYRYSLWTANFRATIGPILEKERLGAVFENIVTRDDVDFIKPYADGFTLIRKDNDPLSDYLMIGDNFTDEGAAKTAGIDFFRVSMDKKE